MKAFALDTEVTTWSKGNPFDQRNKLVCYSYAGDGYEPTAVLDSDSTREQIGSILGSGVLLVMFNGKFDLHWLRRTGIDWSNCRVWCCQLAEYIISRCTQRFPSLEQTAVKYNLGHKIDVIKEQYWDKGINTDEIPWDILSEYAAQDAHLTYQIYLKQLEIMTPAQRRLLSLQCQDLIVLEEMEWNGLRYDPELSEKKASELEKEKAIIEQELHKFYPDIPINFGSNDQLSAFLYGGTIVETTKVHDGFFKTGQKAGQPKYKNVEIQHQLPQLFKPLPNSEMSKEGVYSTAADTLQKLRGKHKPIVAKLLRLSAIDKLVGTYYRGLPKLAAERHWPEKMLYGSYHQVTTRTCRLSSSEPNQQNFAGDVQEILISRF